MPNSYKHRSGDRKEGRLLRSLPASSKFVPYSLPDRDGASFFLDEDLDVTDAEKCLKVEQDGGYEGIGFLHFFIAAYIRCLSMLPGMNRFIVGRRIFARNDIDIVLTVKRSSTVEGSETQVKIRFEPTDTIFDVYRKINERIDELKTEDFSSSREDLAEAAANAPRLFVRLGFLVLRILDYLGWLPQNYLDKSLAHASLVQVFSILLLFFIRSGILGRCPFTSLSEKASMCLKWSAQALLLILSIFVVWQLWTPG